MYLPSLISSLSGGNRFLGLKKPLQFKIQISACGLVVSTLNSHPIDQGLIPTDQLFSSLSLNFTQYSWAVASKIVMSQKPGVCGNGSCVVC